MSLSERKVKVGRKVDLPVYVCGSTTHSHLGKTRQGSYQSLRLSSVASSNDIKGCQERLRLQARTR